MHEIELFVIVDEDGAYTCATDCADCLDNANNDGLSAVRRVVRVVLKVPTPKAIEVIAMLPAEASEATVIVK